MSESGKKYWASVFQEEKTRRLKIWSVSGILAQQSSPTAPEQLLASELERRNVKYVRQHIICGYSVDFFVPEAGMVLEADGCYWHGCDECGFEDFSPVFHKNRDDTIYFDGRAGIVHIKECAIRRVGASKALDNALHKYYMNIAQAITAENARLIL